jgi:hypothetical protein
MMPTSSTSRRNDIRIMIESREVLNIEMPPELMNTKGTH